MIRSFLAATAATFVFAAVPADAREMWSKAEANRWYATQPWYVGANYVPANSINQIEMWQAETFDPATIDKEFGWAQSIGMNTMRVFLHNLLWEQDPVAYKARINTFLEIADRRKLKVMFVLFDSVWDPEPKLGPQRPPIPGVHNSGWVQGPGVPRLSDTAQFGKLEGYVKDIVGTYRNDPRVVVWDLWNEPNNPGGGNYPVVPTKKRLVAALLDKVFDWARAAEPSQPLTSGVWIGQNWDKEAALDEVEKIQIAESDVMSFHDYSWPEKFAERARQMLSYGRPVFCTEYMARGNGSTFDGSLPIAKKLNIAMINWGFVDGDTQTRLPWDSWKKPYTMEPPTIWFHEVFRGDGKPYRQAETDLIRRMAAAPKGVVPADPLLTAMPVAQPARRRR